ncbi:hypothetical protein L6164_011400 [Bauhinia variegata]|uniref:Uncharacterized protein n=1 Tax=Bauhinia variegata TaxID=167791 RepID=A0ACB9P837_BAUVA|nr:hypothetical protein L6164_011400 [Bauhinia variegata]
MSFHSNLNLWEYCRKVYYRKRLRKSTSKPKLPQQIIVEKILPRLPVKSVLSCKSVSKIWYALLSSPEFSELHYQWATQKLTGQKVFVLVKNYVLCLDVETLFTKGHLSNEGEIGTCAVKIDLPMDNVSHGATLASCNGLLCVSLYNVEGMEKIYLWNPAKRCQRLMPILENQNNNGMYSSIGFGYDDSADDYKIVRHRKTSGGGARNMLKVAVFSLKTGVWKTTTTKTRKFKCPIYGQGTYFNGALHWVVDRVGKGGVKEKTRTIMAFDLKTETHYEVRPPKADSKELQVTSVLVFQDCLCAEFHSQKKDTSELWMLKERNSTKSWNKLTNIPGRYIGHPLLQSVAGEVLMLEEQYYDFSRVILSVCNFEEGTSRRVFDFQVQGVQITSVAVHLEGLASPYVSERIFN